MRKLTLIAAALILATPAFAQSVGEKTGVNSVLGIAPSTQDFVTQAASSDMFEIQSSEAAKSQDVDPKIKDFANQMVEAHNKTTSELKSMVEGGKVKATLPTEMASSQKSMLDDLNGRKGSDFGDQYVDDQVSAHKDAVSLFERYSEGGDDPALKEWAGKTLPELKHHLEMAQQLDK
ncbi:DUF4142 domain-containing protein [Hansschlegelia sp.]|uniref:DUF4142 domain-containing protein n=1 Tax=Hansschlegelia sp. TaxID=2041892 RepID=UPI002B565BEE|nr:DUF4142 domain-containing protein [Hansschlegelia sp.]HVI27467.1 DUF4142 domain-containing protein [Hansschlegelia sp.]